MEKKEEEDALEGSSIITSQEQHRTQPMTLQTHSLNELLRSTTWRRSLPKRLKDNAKLSPHYHTSSLEVFHSVILWFSPKKNVGMLGLDWDDLMDMIMEKVLGNPLLYKDKILKINIPLDLSLQYEHSDKEEVIAS
ncbi:hypothetical protein FQN60_004356 [Etheostoma spectabile]|uniref:Uncharacterized protein n=1 Tax=Etheostoma spectabile TaxID=54343 RepID=A0A5J5CTD8_9PERO|nr:hypothetical protein FQN60_004356 [Etheostoma spectabile]